MAKIGRPVKYTPEVIEDIAEKLLLWAEDPKSFWLGEFCIKHGLWRQRLDEFANKSPEFSDALKRVKEIQETRLVLLAMARKIDTTMAIFALKNVAGWRDKRETEHSGQLGVDITTFLRENANGNIPSRN